MGIRTNENTTGSKTFSRDVLRIEKCGPKEDYLTVIDVPGIFRNTEEGVTTELDKVMVLDMVKSYIEQERTIILAVLPCTVDIMTQEILNLSEKYDESGERTLGVLTKPDLLVERSTKTVVCDLVNGKKRPLNLGYYVVRNRGADEQAADGGSTQGREKMFQEEPWCHLPRDRVGVAALRERLQDLLGHITDKAFPKLRAEARKMVLACEKSLADLGVSRHTERDQRMYLSEIAGHFQRIVRGALDASYSSHPELESDDLRLITDIVNLTEQFNHDFISRSNVYDFENGEDACCSEENGQHLSIREPTSLKNGTSKFPELDPIVDLDLSSTYVSGGSIMEWIGQMYNRSRGVELGTFGSGLLSSAFREQTRNWEPMVRSYLGKIVVVIHHFIVTIIGKICTDSKVVGELRFIMDNELLSRYQAAMDEAVFLVGLERDNKPYTLNASFNTTLRGARGLRIAEPLRKDRHDGSSPPEDRKLFELETVVKVMQGKTNGQEASENIHDILKAYYKVARDRIVDTVFRQAVDHCLLTGPMSPLSLFSEKWVLKLDEQNLASIAGEPRRIVKKREALVKKISDLKSALHILR